MRLKNLLFAGLLLYSLVTGGIAFSLWWMAQNFTEGASEEQFADRVREAVFQLTSLSNEYLLDHAERANQQWLTRHQSLGKLLAQALTQFPNSVSQAAVRRMQELHLKAREQFQRTVDSFIAAQQNSAPALVSREKLAANQLQTTMQAMAGEAEQLSANSRDKLNRAQKSQNYLMLGLLGLLGLALAGLWFILSRRVIYPLNRLHEGIESLGAGHLDQRLAVEHRDEIGDLARCFNQMAEQLQATLVSRQELLQEVERRRISEERYELVVRGSKNAIWDFDVLNRQFYFSPRYFEILGYMPDDFEPIEAEWFNHNHPDDRVVLERYWQDCLDGKIDDFEGEFRVLHQDGSWRWLLGRAASNRDSQGKVCRIAGTHSDITRRKQVELERDAALAEVRLYSTELEAKVAQRTQELQATVVKLQEMARMKDEFMATMSHELRTPLQTILSSTDMLSEELFGPINPKQSQYLQNIEHSGEHLLNLINDVLDVAKITAGQMELQFELLSPVEICEKTLKFIAPSAEVKKISLESRLEPVGIIRADLRRLTQILLNLLGNAVKFTPEGGRIWLNLSAMPAERQISIEVCDNGIGISEETIPHLFQPFVQADSRLSRQYEGTGMGLALVKKLVELHSGSVSLQSHPGAGSRFRIILPSDLLIQQTVRGERVS